MYEVNCLFSLFLMILTVHPWKNVFPLLFKYFSDDFDRSSLERRVSIIIKKEIVVVFCLSIFVLFFSLPSGFFGQVRLYKKEIILFTLPLRYQIDIFSN